MGDAGEGSQSNVHSIATGEFFEEAPVGFLVTNPDGEILSANPKFAQWVGVSAQEIIGKRFSDFLTISGKIYVETHLAPLLRMQRQYEEIALELVSAGGPRIPVLINASERRNSVGDPTSILLVIFKSTERRRYEGDLLAARNELRELNSNLAQRVQQEVAERLTAEGRYNAERETAQLREQFIAVLGHDLRNPLAGIGGGLKMLSRKLNDDQSASIIGLMQKSVERMSALVADLLDFARGRIGGGLVLQLQPVDLEEVLQHVCSEIAGAHPEREIRSSIELSRPIQCDRSRISQLLSNLIGNAVSHGDQNGVVRVSCVDKISILEISVANTGPTIPRDILDHLFEPFIRSDSGGHRNGLGLGLYICSEIARAHQGELKAHSENGETRFVFTMPIS